MLYMIYSLENTLGWSKYFTFVDKFRLLNNLK
jgi:hypothetical protein